VFRKMRRSGQELSREEVLEILQNGSDGVLAVLGEGGYPYTVPLNYVLDGGRLYFHCAAEGHKIDALMKCGKASFCVVKKNRVVPRLFATDYKSAVVFGQARIVSDDAVKRRALRALVEKYSPGCGKEGEDEIAKFWDRTLVIELEPEHLTGKAALKKVQEAAREKG